MRHRLHAALLALGIVALSGILVYQPKPVANAAVYKGVDGSNWFQVQRINAVTFAEIDPSRLGGWDTDLSVTASGAGITTSVAGSGAATAVPALSARYQLTTGATAASSVRLFNANLNVTPSTEKVYMAARARIVTATDAQADIRPVAAIGTLANDFLALRLVNGVLNLVLMNGGVATTIATSWTPETTLYHDFAVSSNLVTVRAFVDGAQVGSTTTLTNLDTQPSQFETNTQNGSTTADRQIILDKAVLYTQAP